MNAEYLGRDNCSNGQAVEDVNEGLPGLDVTPSFALVIETVHCMMAISRVSQKVEDATHPV